MSGGIPREQRHEEGTTGLVAPTSVVIVGVGNILAVDDGVGVHAVRQLMKRRDLPAGVRLVEIGTLGPDALGLMPESGAVVILDAVRRDEVPGSIYRIALEDLGRPTRVPLSVHNLGVGHLVAEARLLGRDLRGVLLGVEPARLDPPGTRLSAPVAAALPRLVETAIEEARYLLGGH